MKIKKKELRRGLAQIPINYPNPDVLPESLPGGVVDLDAELVEVELLCKRLAHNEVVVRDEVLAELPRYLKRLTARMAVMESSYAEEIDSVQAYFATHPKTPNPYHYDNLPLALQTFREKVQEADRRTQRREAMTALRKQRAQAKRDKETQGRYGMEEEPPLDEEEEEEVDRVDTAVTNEHRIKYNAWMEAWCDLELIFLKLSRGIHYCLWHSDKPLVQLACAQRIADLLEAPTTMQCKILFYGAIFRVLSREWPTMDRYRLDKYLALVRKMLFAWITYLKQIYKEESASITTAETCSSTCAAAGDGRHKSTEPTTTAVPHAVAKLHTASGIPAAYVRKYFAELPQVFHAMNDVFYILQVQVLPNSTSTGLTMHIADVIFDELTRAELTVPMFVTLAAGIPLYAMSQGNAVEKRVLDQFFPPLAGGVLIARRAQQIVEQIRTNEATLAAKARRTKTKYVALTEEDITSKATELATEENRAILFAMIECCQRFAVARGTAHGVRVMFSEAELVLRQSAEPESFQAVRPAALRRRLEREIDELNETRTRVRDERTAVRHLKRQDRMESIRKEARARRESIRVEKGDAAANEINEKTLIKAVVAEVKAKKAKKPVRDTKRKKDYKLTKKDLYGDAE